MEPYGNPNGRAIDSACGGAVQTCEQKNDYFVDCLNVSCNSNDCSSYFDIPECVTDVYLHALEGGDDSFAALRQISEAYCDKENKEYDRNCNMNYEPLPNEGCGCTGSYNGGAGAGTATCDCDGKPYETGFKDKKRDSDCCGYPNNKYKPEDVNVTPSCAPAWNQGCTCGAAQGECKCKDTYQQDLVNKKPECCVEYKYVAEVPPPKSFCAADDAGCCGSCQHHSHQLVSNKTKLPDRSTFYASDSCDCQNNNNLMLGELDWAELRKAAYSTDNSRCGASDHSIDCRVIIDIMLFSLKGTEKRVLQNVTKTELSKSDEENEPANNLTVQTCNVF